MEKKELYHYGVKGMKWGVRKAQVKSAGKKLSKKLRLAGRVISKKAKQTASDISAKRKAKREEEAKREREKYLTKTNVKKLTSDELVERARILSLRKQALDVEKSCKQINSELVDSGKSFVKTFAKDAVAAAAISAGKSVLGDYFVKLGKDALGLKEDKSKMPEVKTWEDMIKKQTYEANKKKAAKTEAAEKAAAEKKAAAERKAAAQKQVDEYNERWAKGEVNDSVTGGRYSKSGSALDDATERTRNQKTESHEGYNGRKIGGPAYSRTAESERTDGPWSGSVEGEGRSRYNPNERTGPTVEGQWRDIVNSMSTAIVPARTSPNVNSGRSYINNQDLSNYYLEDKNSK